MDDGRQHTKPAAAERACHCAWTTSVPASDPRRTEVHDGRRQLLVATPATGVAIQRVLGHGGHQRPNAPLRATTIEEASRGATAASVAAAARASMAAAQTATRDLQRGRPSRRGGWFSGAPMRAPSTPRLVAASAA